MPINPVWLRWPSPAAVPRLPWRPIKFGVLFTFRIIFYWDTQKCRITFCSSVDCPAKKNKKETGPLNDLKWELCKKIQKKHFEKTWTLRPWRWAGSCVRVFVAWRGEWRFLSRRRQRKFHVRDIRLLLFSMPWRIAEEFFSAIVQEPGTNCCGSWEKSSPAFILDCIFVLHFPPQLDFI